MAQQDYVKRGRAASKKKNTRNTRNQKRRNSKRHTQNNGMPFLRIAIALSAVAGFVFGLYYLHTQSEQPQAVSVDETPVQAPVKKSFQKVDELPVLQEEEWAFIDSLPEYSVEVEVDEQAPSEQDYIMQCGSFRSYEQADGLRARIMLQGLESKILESNGSNGRWYRVVLGPYDRKREAEKQRHALRRANINGCKIW